MTWKQLKIITLQKVFAISDGVLVEEETTQEYLTALPGAANEGLLLLATAGRFLKKKIAIEQGGANPQSAALTAPFEKGAWTRYDLTELAEDFYSLDADGVYFEGGGSYRRPADWTLEAGHIFVLPADQVGIWTLWYNAYPPELKAETPDDYELPLYPEVAALLPLYIASQVYKDDDISLSSQYRNEFEVGRDALMAAAQRGAAGRDSWSSTTGWW